MAGSDAERLRLVLWSPGRRMPLAPPDLLHGLQQALAGGVRTIILREREYPPERLVELCRALGPARAAADAHLILHEGSGGGALDPAGRPRPWAGSMVSEGMVQGVHLTAPRGGHLPGARVRDAWCSATRMQCAVSRSTHDAQELALAQDCDAVTLSPVLPTASHPDGGHLGAEAARAITAQSGVPVVWLGGLDGGNRSAWQPCNGVGIAVLGAFWHAPTATTARALRLMAGP